MKITKLTIKNLFGISEKELDGKSIELTGKNGCGKTSVIDAIRYALTNSSERDLIIKDGVDVEMLREDEKKYPLGRYGKPEDIAGLTVYLLSDISNWMTGGNINITGGSR